MEFTFVEENKWPPVSYLQELAQYKAERRMCAIMWYMIQPPLCKEHDPCKSFNSPVTWISNFAALPNFLEQISFND